MKNIDFHDFPKVFGKSGSPGAANGSYLETPGIMRSSQPSDEQMLPYIQKSTGDIKAALQKS